MSSKEFCESGKHVYAETDIVKSLGPDGTMYVVVSCGKCDSKFLRHVDFGLP